MCKRSNIHTSTPSNSDLTEIDHLKDPRLSRADITQRLTGIAALNTPIDRYCHSDGSIWNGYGELDLAATNADPAATDFWVWMMTERHHLLQVANYALTHSLDPVTGLPMEQAEEYFTASKTRFKAAIAQPIEAAYIIAARVQERLDWYREFEIGMVSRGANWAEDESISDLFAAGADPDQLMMAGILDDDEPNLVAPPAVRQWSVWADDRNQAWIPTTGCNPTLAEF